MIKIFKSKKVLIVGVGLTGITLAEQLASYGHKVVIVDKREHIGGNCYDYKEKGVLVHKYGPHQFRTNSSEVKKYLSRFTEWVPYQGYQKSVINSNKYTFPINRKTINEVFKLNLKTTKETKHFINILRDKTIKKPNNSEEFVLSKCGRILYEMFYKYYTIKQWGVHPTELMPSVCGRVPIYYDDSIKYTTGKENIMPKNGYTEMFLRMLNHPNITINLGETVHSTMIDYDKFGLIIWTGRVDEFYGYPYGELPYRSLRFEFKHYDEEYHQGTYKLAYPSFEVDQTRDIEYKYITGQKCEGTVISREYPTMKGEPYYPIYTTKNMVLYEKYKKLVNKETKVIFLGRLAEYKYYDMDDIVEKVLIKSKEIMKTLN